MPTVYWFSIDSGWDEAVIQTRYARVGNKESIRDEIESVKQKNDRQKASSSLFHLKKRRCGWKN